MQIDLRGEVAWGSVLIWVVEIHVDRPCQVHDGHGVSRDESHPTHPGPDGDAVVSYYVETNPVLTDMVSQAFRRVLRDQ